MTTDPERTEDTMSFDSSNDQPRYEDNRAPYGQGAPGGPYGAQGYGTGPTGPSYATGPSYTNGPTGPSYGGAPGMSPETERQLSCAAHWSPIASVLLGGLTFFGPVIVLLVNGGRSREVRRHCMDALNFQITVWIVTVVWFVLSLLLLVVGIGFLMLWVVPVFPLLALFVHGVAAAQTAAGRPFRYPMTLRLLR